MLRFKHGVEGAKRETNLLGKPNTSKTWVWGFSRESCFVFFTAAMCMHGIVIFKVILFKSIIITKLKAEQSLKVKF